MIAWRSLAALALVLGTATRAAAGEPTERLRTFFERANGVILAPEAEGSADARVAAVRALVTEIFDVDGAAALALGRRWEALAPPARATFTRLYADVVERAYLAWVGSKARVGEGGVSVRWLEELVDGDGAAVRSVLLTRAGGELPIDYRLVRREGDWLVRDVVVVAPSVEADSAELVCARADGGWFIQRTRRNGADLAVHTKRMLRFFVSPLRRGFDRAPLAPIVFSWLADRGAGATRLDPHDNLRRRLAAVLRDEELFVARVDQRTSEPSWR